MARVYSDAMTFDEVMNLLARDTWPLTAADDARDEVEASWDKLAHEMRRGALVAVGRRPGSPDVVSLPAQAWRTPPGPDLASDMLRIDGVHLHDMTFHQPVTMPDFARRLVQVATLADAFRLFVLGNPVLRAAVSQADGMSIIGPSQLHSFACGDLLSGGFPSSAGAWPVRLDRFDMASAWLETEPRSFEAVKRDLAQPVAALATVERSAAIVCEVFARFLRPLRQGLVQVRGHHFASGQLGPIAPAVWSSSDIGIDEHGRLGSIENGRFSPLWNAVHFTVGEISPSKVRDRTKRKDGIEWDYALDQMMFYMHGSGRFSSKKKFATQIIDLLEGRKQPSEEQVYDFFADFYPQFWALLDR